MSITEVLVPNQPSAWLPWAVQYLFYIGSAYAAGILFFIALLWDHRTTHRLRAALVLTLAISAVVGALSLTADLHQPGRAWNFYAHLSLWSWMSIGSLLIPLFASLAIVTAWLYLREDLIRLGQQHGILSKLSLLSLGKWHVSRPMMLTVSALMVVSGLSIALYTGAEISAVQARPLWHQPALTILWLMTAFLGAVGLSLILWLLFSNGKAKSYLSSFDLRLLKQSLCSCSLVSVLVLFIWASHNVSFSLFEDHRWVVKLSALAITLLMCATFSNFMLRDNYRKISLVVIALISIGVSWMIRWVTIMDVQTIAKFDVGSYVYSFPMGNNGLLGIVSMLGLWLGLAVLASEVIQTQYPTMGKQHQMNTNTRGFHHG